MASALEEGFGEPFSEASFARHVMAWLEDKDAHADLLEAAASYAAWALHTEAGRARHEKGVLFRQPAKTDPMCLVCVDSVEIEGIPMQQMPKERLHQRDGFAFVDSSSG